MGGKSPTRGNRFGNEVYGRADVEGNLHIRATCVGYLWVQVRRSAAYLSIMMDWEILWLRGERIRKD